MSEGCSGGEQVNNDGTSICGNGVTEAGESCDDGNANDNDGCTAACTSSTCGDGVVQAENGEECDNGGANGENNACSSSCTSNSEFCGNGDIDGSEECDDGNSVTDDACTNACTDPICGDGIVQAGEDCDDGNNELMDSCPPSCLDGGGGNPCNGQSIYAGLVDNDSNPAMDGPGVPAVWSYAGEIGVKAGNEMCAAIGADHVCSYQEVVDAEAAGELDTGTNPIPDGTEFWVHRVATTLPRLSEATMSPPGPGGRCNDWTYPTNHISDGEFGYYHRSTAPTAAAMASTVGNMFIFVDDDTLYTPAIDTANMLPVGGDHACDAGVTGANAAVRTPGCSGSCGGADPKAILCCFPACIP